MVMTRKSVLLEIIFMMMMILVMTNTDNHDTDGDDDGDDRTHLHPDRFSHSSMHSLEDFWSVSKPPPPKT